MCAKVSSFVLFTVTAVVIVTIISLQFPLHHVRHLLISAPSSLLHSSTPSPHLLTCSALPTTRLTGGSKGGPPPPPATFFKAGKFAGAAPPILALSLLPQCNPLPLCLLSLFAFTSFLLTRNPITLTDASPPRSLSSICFLPASPPPPPSLPLQPLS